MSDIIENRTVANRYKLCRKIGDGGMGNIFLADDLQLSRQVAVKTIRRELKENPEVRKRIDRECNLHATLGVHPNIIALHDKIVEDNDIFLIMEYVEGETLTTYLKKSEGEKTQQQLKERVSITCQVLEALAHIHDNDILHRDIKPSNIILSRKNPTSLSVKLMDFGIASLDREDSALTQLTTLDTGGPGTPTYMAPERIDSTTFGESGPPTDLYSVGVILYELLGKGPPFQGTMTEVFTGHLAKQPSLSMLPASIPDALVDVLKKSLEKEQTRRFQNAREFTSALQNIDLDSQSESYEQGNQTEDSLEQTLLATDLQREAIAEAVALSKIPEDTRGGLKLFAIVLGVLCVAGLIWGGWHLLRPADTDVTAVSPENSKETDSQGAVGESQNQAKNDTSVSVASDADSDNLNEKNEEVVLNPFSSSSLNSKPDRQELLTPTLGRHPYSVPGASSNNANSALSAFTEHRQKNSQSTTPETTSNVTKTTSVVKQDEPVKREEPAPKTSSKSVKKENKGWKIIENKTEKVN
jgi:serine/threonine-protein kinase